MKKTIISLLSVISLLLCACGQGTVETSVNTEMPELSAADTSGMDFSFSDRDYSTDYNEETAKALGESYEITAEGTYVLSGDITDTTVKITVGDKEKVWLVLDNANIRNSQGPAIFVVSGDKVFITAKEGTANFVSDGENYSLVDGETDIDGAIFSRADLTINGSGSLEINGNSKHAVVSKDDLAIVSASLTLNSKNVALNGKDCVKITDSQINITAGSDAIRSDNTEDASRGYVYIQGGKAQLTAGNDGIQAETVVKLENAELSVASGGGSGNKLVSGDESFKGIKAGSDILVSGGEIKVDSRDDSLHSNNTISIESGVFELSSGDDGIHADTDLSVSGGSIKITKSYEGLEASRILISGGEIDITASDDGLNAAGGNDQSGFGGRPGMGGFSNGIGEIIISGGFILVNASGDGIDSNSTFAMTGGTVLVSGPTNSGNGAFDYDKAATVTGGVLVALGSSGMAQGFSSAENQGAILSGFASQSAGTSFAVCDAEGKVIVSFTPEKAYQSAVVTAPELQSGNKYTFVAGGTVADADSNGFARNTTLNGGTALCEIELTSNLYSQGGGFGGPGGGGPGGFGGGQRPERPDNSFAPGGGDHGGGASAFRP